MSTDLLVNDGGVGPFHGYRVFDGHQHLARGDGYDHGQRRQRRADGADHSAVGGGPDGDFENGTSSPWMPRASGAIADNNQGDLTYTWSADVWGRDARGSGHVRCERHVNATQASTFTSPDWC